MKSMVRHHHEVRFGGIQRDGGMAVFLVLFLFLFLLLLLLFGCGLRVAFIVCMDDVGCVYACLVNDVGRSVYTSAASTVVNVVVVGREGFKRSSVLVDLLWYLWLGYFLSDSMVHVCVARNAYGRYLRWCLFTCFDAIAICCCSRHIPYQRSQDLGNLHCRFCTCKTCMARLWMRGTMVTTAGFQNRGSYRSKIWMLTLGLSGRY